MTDEPETVPQPTVEVTQDEDCVDINFHFPGQHAALSVYVRRNTVVICGAGEWNRPTESFTHDAFLLREPRIPG